MTYSGNNLSQLAGTLEGDWKLWLYKSADTVSTVAGAGYFSDGVTRGMELNDVVIIIDTTTPARAIHAVSTVSGNAATAAASTVVLT